MNDTTASPHAKPRNESKGDPGCPPASSENFIVDVVRADLASGKHGGRLMTRFPPEPNGYLHIGHAKAICLNFAIAKLAPHGVCNIRFDDTNPETEEAEFVESEREDIHWLGFDWAEREYYASDYFERLYDYAEELVKRGKAYVDSQKLEEVRAGRGDFYRGGSESPYRGRTVEENLGLLRRMRDGLFEDGEHVLRAKIDMQSKDVKMRDPVMYRIRRAKHYRTGDRWNIYPMYDFAHCLSDALEGITHSLCTLEYQNHRALYHWFLDALETPNHPEQIEFARLNLTYTVLSKRKLQQLVGGKHVAGWDDPRMPTLAGFRRRGYTPEAIREFCNRIGVAKRDGFVDMGLLEHMVREDLNERAHRVMGVLRPLRVVIENLPEGVVENFDAPYHPEDGRWGSRIVPLSRVVYIERDDFMEDPPKKWFRLAPGREVRLRYAALITCKDVVKDASTGEIVELRCVWDPASRGGTPADGRKVRGTIHWVSAAHALDAEVRLYDRLFATEHPGDESGDYLQDLNPKSIEVLRGCKLEPALAASKSGDRSQFERLGYFCADTKDHQPGRPVFNRTVTLRDSWAKLVDKGQTDAAAHV